MRANPLAAKLTRQLISRGLSDIAFALVGGLLLFIAVVTDASAQNEAAFGFFPNSEAFTFFNGVSADGSVATGGTGGFRDYDPLVVENLSPLGTVSPSGNVHLLPRTPAGASSDATGISGDGNVVFGRSFNPSATQVRAARWTRNPGGGWAGSLLRDENGDATGDLPDGSVANEPYASSFDGSVIVGKGTGDNGTEAFRWTEATGMQGLGDLPGGISFAAARGVSNDGTVIVGQSISSNGNEGFRWTAATGMVGLGDFPGGATSSDAFGISGDGAVVVGNTGVPSTVAGTTTIPGGQVPAYWTEGGGWVDLGPLPDGEAASTTSRSGLAMHTSFDGSVIVGTAPIAGDSNVFVWTAATGMRSLKQLLLDEGVSDLEGWELLTVEGISADGRTIVGSAQSPINSFDAYVARLPASLIAVTNLFGDADNNLAVSGSDLLAVTNNFGNTGPADGLLLGDADDNGSVSGSDLLAVTNNFGATAGTLQSSHLVPEPKALLLLLYPALLAGVALARQNFSSSR